MSKDQIIRAWKDQAFRESLSAEERAAPPASPASPVELSEEQLASVLGGLDKADPGRSAATSWKPMCRETATWIYDLVDTPRAEAPPAREGSVLEYYP